MGVIHVHLCQIRQAFIELPDELIPRRLSHGAFPLGLLVMELFRHSPIMGPKQRLHEPIIVVSLSGAERTHVDLSKRAFRSITPLPVPRSCGVPNQAHLTTSRKIDT